MNIYPSNKTQAACLFSIDALPMVGGHRYLWTLTTPDVVEYKEISRRWFVFLRRFKRAFPNTSGVRVMEMHGGAVKNGKGKESRIAPANMSHGWHIHFLVGERIEVEWIRKNAQDCGFGRVHVERIPASRCGYVAKYLTKQERLPWMKGFRLWRRWGPFKGTRAADVVCDSPAARAWRYVMKQRDALGAQFREGSFIIRKTIVEWFLIEDLVSLGRKYGFYECLPEYLDAPMVHYGAIS